MITVAIIGILAILAIPAYQKYVIRAQISEGLAVSSGAKAAVSDFYANYGAWPKDNDEAGIAAEGSIIGNYTEHVKITDNVIEIKFGFKAHQNLKGETITLVATDYDGSISWSCAGDGNIADSELPRVCRDGGKGSKKKK